MSVMLYHCSFCVSLLIDLFVLWVACLTELNNSQYFGCVCYGSVKRVWTCSVG